MSERQGLLSKVFGSRGLKGISEIRTFFRTNEQPIFFIGPTAFNLLGIDRWVRGFEYIVYHDSWDGAHPRIFAPSNRPYVEFQSSEEIVNYLLRDAVGAELWAFRDRQPPHHWFLHGVFG